MKHSELPTTTPLGTLLFSASIQSGEASLDLKLCKPATYLPPGMSVDQLEACVLQSTTTTRISELIYECYWESPFAKGSAESGECLDAQSWRDEKSIVMIGTEDFDTLRQRLPMCVLSEKDWPPFPDNGLRIKIPVIEAHQSLSLHFVVASNPLPEPKECSCWFAVDIDHTKILAHTR